MKIKLLLIALSLPTLLFAQSEYIQFNGKNKFYKAEGFVNNYEFKSFTWDQSDPTSIKANIEIDLNSISEKNKKLTNHLKSEDFFNVEVFPKAIVDIVEVQLDSDTTYKAVGLLTIKNIEKKIFINFNLNNDSTRLSGHCSFNRTDYKISDNKGIDELVIINFFVKIPLESELTIPEVTAPSKIESINNASSDKLDADSTSTQVNKQKKHQPQD